jgi:hypothetical protein
MTTPRFPSWRAIENFIVAETGCKPFSGAGINYRKAEKVCILRSVDGTAFYDDNMEDVLNPQYTLFGHNGDQDINEPKFNEPLMNPLKTSKIYLYRVTGGEYVWYGEYKISSNVTKRHPGMDGVQRNIVVLNLQKIIH